MKVDREGENSKSSINAIVIMKELPLLTGFAPFYRYVLHGHDHFHTTSIAEIGTATLGNHGYTSEGTECVIRRLEVTGSVPLFRYYHQQLVDHFYTTNAGEIGTTTPGVIGNHGYRSEGRAGYCFSSQVPNTIPLFRYYNPTISDHFYTTNSMEIGTTTVGQVG